MKIDKKQLKFLIRKKSLKQKDIAEMIGVGQQDFNNWMFRGVIPHFDKLEEIAKILDVPVEELYRKNSFEDPQGTYQGQFNLTPDLIIPFYELEKHSDFLLLSKDSHDIPVKDHIYIPGLNVDFVFMYHGNGMEPTIESGDFLGVRILKNFNIFNYGNPYIIVTKEQAFIRNVRKSSDSKSILLQAESSRKDEIELKTSSIKAAFAVVSVIKRNII